MIFFFFSPRKFILTLTTALLFTSLTFAESPEEKGLKIATEAREKNRGFMGEEADMKMVLIDAHGTQTMREMQGKVLEVEGDGNRSLSIFLNPKDVKGTKMLTWAHRQNDDDQWLYLPSMKRTKRISSSNKSSSFMGSEFSYEDLGSQEVEKYGYKFLKDEKMNGMDCWVMERTPKKESGYSKQIITMAKKYYNPLKIEYFDRRGELLKTATFSDYKEYKVGSKNLWMADQIHMNNVQTQKQSTFSWQNRQVGKKLAMKEFETKSLE